MREKKVLRPLCLRPGLEVPGVLLQAIGDQPTLVVLEAHVYDLWLLVLMHRVQNQCSLSSETHTHTSDPMLSQDVSTRTMAKVFPALTCVEARARQHQVDNVVEREAQTKIMSVESLPIIERLPLGGFGICSRTWAFIRSALSSSN